MVLPEVCSCRIALDCKHNQSCSSRSTIRTKSPQDDHYQEHCNPDSVGQDASSIGLDVSCLCLHSASSYVRWLLQNTAILYKHLQFAATIDHLVICIFVALAISIAVILRDSLLSLGLTYLLFSLGTEQFAHRNDDQLQYILVFTLASVMLLATVVVGVSQCTICVDSVADGLRCRALGIHSVWEIQLNDDPCCLDVYTWYRLYYRSPVLMKAVRAINRLPGSRCSVRMNGSGKQSLIVPELEN